MQPNLDIQPGVLDNQARFDNAFFRRFKLRHAPSPLELSENISKDYLFPTFYGDVSCAIGIFLCDYQQAQALMPHPKMKPVAMPKGRALVTFSCYEYKQVLGLPAYNEIAMTIPVMIDPLLNVPVLPMLIQGFKNFGYYVFHMPVTSKENQLRGQKIWGLPKQVETINIKNTEQSSTTAAIDAAGNHYLNLTLPTQGHRSHFDVTSNLYSKLNGRLLKSSTCFKGDFSVNKFTNRLWQQNSKNPPALELGTGPVAAMLKTLNIDPSPFQTRFTPSMSACFDLADPHYQAPFAFDADPLKVNR